MQVTARAVCRLVLWQRYDMIILLASTIQHVPTEKQRFDSWACAEPWTCPFKTIFRLGSFFLSSVSRVDKDGRGLKLEKVRPTFSTFNAMPGVPWRNLWYLLSSTQTFCVWLQWRIQGRGPGSPAPPPLFLDQVRPEGPKKFSETGPPISQGLDDAPPPPLLIWRSGSATGLKQLTDKFRTELTYNSDVLVT